MFWTNVAILILVFISVAVSVSIFVSNYTISKQINSIISISDTVEHWSGTLQIEDTDVREWDVYQQTLDAWGEFLKADIIVVNKDGELTGSTCDITTVPEDFLEDIMNGGRVIEKTTFNGAYQMRVLSIGLPVRYNGTIIGAMFFNSYLPDIKRSTTDLILLFMVASIFSICFAFVLVYVQSRRISKPIGEINYVAQNIAAGNFSERVKVTSGDEIGQLASSFNFMAASIEDLENQRQSFVSDVSHELRTPMTSISGFIEGILDGTIPEEKRADYLRIVLDETRRLTRLVNDLLDMSKMSSSEYQLDIKKFDINELIRICIISLEGKISDRNLDLNVDFSKDVINVLADQDSIKRVLINLMDNAIKFSYPNTIIGINTWIEDGRAHICIGNFGDGIDGADLSNVFNRFYKTDKSRTNSNNKSGAGLGLSLVKNILTLHKQSIWVESVDTKEGSKAKYTKFTFTLELA
ncbi:MAG: cell wall metabolism sensor histidine kinase WalK [Oscillospiraceae bacterium]|nr:cell wall metabolism sensor histidine kinase WalK [Oscillospiraceae bacterium]